MFLLDDAVRVAALSQKVDRQRAVDVKPDELRAL
jgi:hypothetical protein